MHRILFALFVSLFLATSCQREPTPDVPDISDIAVDVDIRRFEQDLFQLDTNNMADGLARLEQKYPRFSRIYFDRILRSRDSLVAPEGHAAYIRGFITFPSVRQLYDTTQTVFSDMASYRDAYRQAFQLFAYYYPGQPIPNVTTFISEYSVGAFIYGDNQLAVGLDFFLGDDYPYLQYNPNNPNFSAYLTRTFTPEHLVAKSLRPLVDDRAGQPGGQRLLDMMIHNGKKLYLLDKLLPYTPDSIKLEMTAAQVEWLESSERSIWAFFLEEDLLYSAEWQKVRKYVDYSPNSPGMPPEAPGRTGNWIGWQIVKSFMNRYPETSMEELMQMRDAPTFLEQSKYKPAL